MCNKLIDNEVKNIISRFKQTNSVIDATKKALDEGHHGYVLPNGIIECRTNNSTRSAISKAKASR